ncbi:hypothetical protein HZC35_07495 [Candidatus Saganbacteria bacterium]|nr:hypothetical protein [Candidatus Saganbacteria bacterium]
MDILISSNRPLLAQKLNSILDRLTANYCAADTSLLPSPEKERYAANIAILKRAPFKIHLLESYEINAYTHPQTRSIYVALGIFDALIGRHPELACWDTVAFVIAHEISHVIFNEQAGSAAAHGQHDMENQCDRDALKMMDKAGFNVRFAGFDFFPDKDISADSTNFGLISSHPNPYARNRAIKDLVREGYSEKYRDVTAERSFSFSSEEIDEIRLPSSLETMLERKKNPGAGDLGVGLLRCFNVLVDFLSVTAVDELVFIEDVRTAPDPEELARIAPDPDLRAAFDRFLAIRSEVGDTNEDKLKRAYFKHSPNDPKYENFINFAWYHFIIKINRASFSQDLREQSLLGGIEFRKCFFNRQQSRAEIREKTGIDKSSGRTINAVISSLEVPDNIKNELISIFDGILGIFSSSSHQASAPGDILELLRALPCLPSIDNQHSKQLLPYKPILRVINQELAKRVVRAVFANSENTQRCREALELISLAFFNLIPLNQRFFRERDESILTYPADILLPAIRALIEANDQRTIAFLLDRLASDSLVQVLNDEGIFLFLQQNSQLSHPAAAKAAKTIPWRTLEGILLSDKFSSFWLKVVECSNPSWHEISWQKIEEILENIGKRLLDPREVGRARKQLAMTLSRSLARSDNPSIKECLKIFAIFPALDFSLWEIIKTAEVEELIQLLKMINFDSSTVEEHELAGCLSTGQLVVEILSRLGLDYLFADIAMGLPDGARDRYYERNKSQTINSFQPITAKNWLWSEIWPISYIQYQMKLSDEMFLLLIKHANRSVKTFLIAAFLDKLIKENRFDEIKLRLAALAAGNHTHFGSFPESQNTKLPLLSESLGPRITHQDQVYLTYFRRRGTADLQNLSPKELGAWFNAYWPQKSSYRDVVLVKLFREGFDHFSLEDQKMIISLFLHEERAFRFKTQCYKQHLSTISGLHEKLRFLESLFPKPSPLRDQYLNEILMSSSFTVEEYGKTINPLFSGNSRDFQREESIALGTLGAALNNEEAENKAEIILWLLGKAKKPFAIRDRERDVLADLDEIKELFSTSKPFRDELIDNLFAGNKGLFLPAHQHHLDNFLDTALHEFLRVRPEDAPEIVDLKRFAGKALKEFFHLASTPTKLRVMQALAGELIEHRERPSLAVLVAAFLRSYGAAGVKFAQILASRKEVEEHYPELYRRLCELKDNANPMIVEEALKAVYTNPRLVGRGMRIIRPIGSASIKGVFLVEIEGREYILKVRRPAVYKDLNEEERCLRELLSALEPELGTIYGVSHLPDYAARIFGWIGEEVDFAKEKDNMVRLREVLSSSSTGDFILSVPFFVPDLTNHNTIIEEIAPGASLKEIENDPTQADLVSVVKPLLQRAVLEQLFDQGFFHADPHSGNIFVRREEDRILISFIDAGLCSEVDERTKVFLRKISHPLKRDLLAILGDFLPLDIFDKNQNLIAEEVDLIQSQPPQKQVLALLSLFDKLEGYQAPETLIRIITGISKAPFLFEVFPENQDIYSRIWPDLFG